MKAKPWELLMGEYWPCEPAEATHVELNMPGPLGGPLFIPVLPEGVKREGTPCWSWNQDTEAPTLKPSLLSLSEGGRCHSFVTDGKARFLQDCSHALKGQVVDLLEVEP